MPANIYAEGQKGYGPRRAKRLFGTTLGLASRGTGVFHLGGERARESDYPNVTVAPEQVYVFDTEDADRPVGIDGWVGYSVPAKLRLTKDQAEGLIPILETATGKDRDTAWLDAAGVQLNKDNLAAILVIAHERGLLQRLDAPGSEKGRWVGTVGTLEPRTALCGTYFRSDVLEACQRIADQS